jgi:endonuclease YncB( thermonuclease family)
MWRIFVLLGCLPMMVQAEVYFAEVTHVSDGDTLWVKPGAIQSDVVNSACWPVEIFCQ